MTRLFRRSEDDTPVDQMYVPRTQLPENERIQMSEHIYQEWKNIAGNTPLRTIVSADIENTPALRILERLSKQEGFPRSGSFGRGGPNGNQQAWDEIMAGSAGSPILHAMKDHHNRGDRIFGNRLPSQIDWRFRGGIDPNTGKPAAAYIDEDAGIRDAFIILTLT
jgi:hypothetical protein